MENDDLNSVTKVILDTNALLMPFQFKVDIEKELDRILGTYELLVPSSVIHELELLKDKHAKPALKLARRFRTIEVDEKGDKAIIKLAEELNAMVVTNDKNLRNDLEEVGVKVIFLRQKSYLTIK